jgi:hypothetical protein
MFSLDEAGDRVAVVQMNSELRQAQLEMLSAQCATDRLRLRYTAEEIARHGQRDLLRKAWASANALAEYYNAIAQHLPDRDSFEKSGTALLNEARTVEAIERVARYLQEQREYFHSIGQLMERPHREIVEPFFSAALLAQVRVVILDRQRIPNPPFYAEARALGFTNLPDVPHMASLTFGDTLVFHGALTTRSIFHALVHAVQVEVLGLEQYADLMVRGLVRARAYVSVPMEAHAFLLESTFAENQTRVFSVEEKVRLWVNQGRY